MRPDEMELERDVRLRNELADSNELLDYAKKLLAIDPPKLTTASGIRTFVAATKQLMTVAETCGAFSPTQKVAAE